MVNIWFRVKLTFQNIYQENDYFKNHIDNAVEELSDYIQKVYNENFKELVRNINNTTEIIKGIIDGLNLSITMLYEKESLMV